MYQASYVHVQCCELLKSAIKLLLHTRNRECLHIYSRHVMKKKQQPQHRLSVANLEISSPPINQAYCLVLLEPAKLL